MTEQLDYRNAVENDYIIKSNALIFSKFKSPLQENKLTMLALLTMKKNSENKIISVLRIAEIKKAIGREGCKGGSFYQNILDTSIQMTNRKIIMQDENGFDIVNLIQRTNYDSKNGVITITWNDEVEPILINLTEKYSKLKVHVLMSFTSSFSFRLYEILRGKSFYKKGISETNKKGVFKFSINLPELQLMIGAIDCNDKKIQRMILPKGKQESLPEWEKAVGVDPKTKKYNEWRNFRIILQKAVLEINEKSELDVSFNALKSGQGHKVYAVEFIVINKELLKSEEIVIESTMDDERMDQAIDILGSKLKMKDIRIVLQAADNNIEKIKKATEVLNASGNVDNIVGFLIQAIKKDYDVLSQKKVAKKTTFSNFQERTYDYDELEKKLLCLQTKRNVV